MLDAQAIGRLRLVKIRLAMKRRHKRCPKCKERDTGRIPCSLCARMICLNPNCDEGICQWCDHTVIRSTRTGVEQPKFNAPTTPTVLPPERRAKVERRINNNVRYPGRFRPIVETLTAHGLELKNFDKEEDTTKPYPQYFTFVWRENRGAPPSVKDLDAIDGELDKLPWKFAAINNNDHKGGLFYYIVQFRAKA